MTAVPWYPRVTSVTFPTITEKAAEMLRRIRQQYPQQSAVPLSITGSAGMGMATSCGIPFIQEVYATRLAAKTHLPGTDVIIELGGEDAEDPVFDRRHGSAYERHPVPAAPVHSSIKWPRC